MRYCHEIRTVSCKLQHRRRFSIRQGFRHRAAHLTASFWKCTASIRDPTASFQYRRPHNRVHGGAAVCPYWGSETPILGRSNPHAGEIADLRRGESLHMRSEHEVRPVAAPCAAADFPPDLDTPKAFAAKMPCRFCIPCRNHVIPRLNAHSAVLQAFRGVLSPDFRGTVPKRNGGQSQG